MFNTLNISRSTKYLNQDVLFNSRIENRMVTFGFNYKFGNFRLNSNKKEVDLDERDRLRKLIKSILLLYPRNFLETI